MGCTVHRNIEEALRESEQRLRALADNLSNAVVYQLMAEPDGGRRFTYISRSVERLNEVTVEEVLADAGALYGQVLPEYRALVAAREEEALKTLTPLHVEVQSRLPGGRLRWFEFTSTPRYIAEGVLVWDGVEVDITDRKRTEAELERLVAERTSELIETNQRLLNEIADRSQMEMLLRDSEERYRSLYWESRDAIMVLSPEEGFLAANPATAALFACRDEQEFITHSPASLSPEFQPDGIRSDVKVREIKRLALEKGSRFFEWTHRRVDGTEFPATVLLSGFNYCGKRLLMATVRDITESKRAEAERRDLERQVQHAQKLESLGVLAGGLAHDFNNILHLILGNVHHIKKIVSDLSPARPFIENIERSTRRAAVLTRQMLAYAGKGSFTLQVLNLGDLVGEIVGLIQSSMSKKARLRLNLVGDLPPIEADAAQIQQVAMNVILNAAEALDADEGGEVIVSTSALYCTEDDLRGSRVMFGAPAGDYVCLDVTDTGCGMDGETLERLFDPFFTTKFTGRGLGMSAVLGIVRAHKGVILVRSAPGAGTTVRILLPVADRTDPAPSDSAPASAADRPSCAGVILFVDDEPDMLELGAMTLEQMGYRVLTAADGLDALELFEEQSKDIGCVLLDLSMPRMDGVQTLAELRRIRPDIPVILASGYAERELQSRLAGLEVSALIEKPYDFDKLASILQQVLA